MSARMNSSKDKVEILVVEDSPTQAEQLKHLLEKHGYRVKLAIDGKRALTLLGECQPALVISDILMPEMNGYEFCQRLKANERTQDIPVILLTSLSDPADVLEGLACGADNFITKPYSSDYLLSHLEQVLANRKISKGERVRVGVEIMFAGKRRFITASQQQILSLLISTYEAAVHRNRELIQAQDELRALNEHLEDRVKERTTALSAESAERKRAEQEVRHRLNELEMLYASSLAFSQLLRPKEIGQKIIDIISESLHWHYAAIIQYHPEMETFELLAYNHPDIENEVDHLAAEAQYKKIITNPGQGFSSWVIQHGQSVYCGDVTKDERYVEVWPTIRSGMYVPLKIGERTIGCLSVGSERVNAFTETDEWLITTLATQAASALENAHLFAETRQRLTETEAVNKISIALRTAESLENMLPAFLDETLTLLDTQSGAIWLFNEGSEELHQTVSRGCFTQLPKAAVKPGEGLAGTVFATGNPQLLREFISNMPALDAGLRQISVEWGGICVPIRSMQAVVGVMLIFVQLPRELTFDEIRVLNILAEIVGIAIQRMSLHEQSEQQLEYFKALHEIDTVIAASFDLSFTLDTILKNVLSQLHVDAACILLLNRPTRMLDYTAGKGFRKPGLEQSHISISEGYAGRAVRERHTIHSEDLSADTPFFTNAKLVKIEGFVSYYGVPLIVKGEVKGVLEIFHRTSFIPKTEWLDFLEALAGQTAIAIDSYQTYDNLQRSNMELVVTYDMTLQGWSRALDMRDKETEGHSERVTEMAMQLARVLAVRDLDIEHIRHGALLHDMGKIGIPDSILLKPGPLTAEEWEMMRTHPVRAYELLSPIPYLRPALEIPYCHHEKWDGSGYPRGLKGDRIPLAARIFSVVDVYDALTSDRPYRKAWLEAKVLEHLKTESGKHFDPQVLEAFLKMKDKD